MKKGSPKSGTPTIEEFSRCPEKCSYQDVVWRRKCLGNGSRPNSSVRDDPPTPAELEQAIDLVEDALTGLPIVPADGDWLVTADALLRRLPGFGSQDAGLAREAVEALFQQLASRALGMPIAGAELPQRAGDSSRAAHSARMHASP